MRNLYKFSAIVLMVALAGAAAAADLSSTTKIQPVKAPATEMNKGLLDCSGAIEITLDNVYAGDTTGAANNVSTYGCSTWNEGGGEAVFHLYLATPAMWEASVTASVDLDLAVLDQCDETLGCLIVADSGVVTNVPVSGDYYFVVDGYGTAAGAFTFEIATIIPPEPVDNCPRVMTYLCQAGQISGDTCDAVNGISAEGCEAYTEAGLDEWYEITLNPAGSFTASVTNTADGALWVVDECVEPFNCLAYADDTLSGQAEVVSYTNDTAVIKTVYLVVDSWGTDSCGTYTGDITCSGGIVADEPMSFGQVKALYSR
jgi:hypothetical protein